MIVLLYTKVYGKGKYQKKVIKQRMFKPESAVLIINNNEKTDSEQYSIIVQDEEILFSEIVKTTLLGNPMEDSDGSLYLYSKIQQIMRDIEKHQQEQDEKKNVQ